MSDLAALSHIYEDYERSLVGKDQREQFRLADRVWPDYREMQRQVAARFGALNGWMLSTKPFTSDAIGRTQCSWNFNYRRGLGTEWMDHAIYYRAKVPGRRLGRNIAIVGQPYDDGRHRREALDADAVEFGLRWHMPPQPFASIWYPGCTLFIVMTLPEIKVRWLPEQSA
jgi:hypothetical protein